MPWKECHVVDERLRFIARLLDGEKMAHLCAEFGISRKTGYKIYDRYRDCGAEALTDRSRRPYRYANRLPPVVEPAILRLKWDTRVGRAEDSRAAARAAPRAAVLPPSARCTRCGGSDGLVTLSPVGAIAPRVRPVATLSAAMSVFALEEGRVDWALALTVRVMSMSPRLEGMTGQKSGRRMQAAGRYFRTF